MSLAGEDLAAFSGLGGQDLLAAGPVGGIFAVVRVAEMLVGDPRLVVQYRVERVLGSVGADPRPAPRGGLQEGPLVVAGPGVDAGPMLADIARQEHRQIGGAVVQRGVEVMVDPLADVDRDRVAGLGRLPDVLGQPPHQRGRGAGDLLDGLEVVVGEVPLVHREDRHDLHGRPVEQGDAERPFERGLDRHLLADLVARQRRDLACLGVPDAEVADPARCWSVSPWIV